MSDKLRFKDKNGHDYPEWENEILGKLCITEQKSKYPASYGKNDGLYPFILSNTSNEMKYADIYILNSESIIVNDGGEAYFRYINGKFAYSDHCIVLTTNENTKYIYYYLDANKKIINQKGFVGGGLKNIDRNYLKSFIIKIPTTEEQQKIADFLSTVDEKIENQKELVANWEEIKKGLIKKIFSQEIIFKDENGQDYPEWDYSELGKYCYIQGGYAFKSSSFKTEGVPIIKIANLQEGTIGLDKDSTVYYDSLAIDERFYVKQNDILIAMSGATTGKIGVYKSDRTALLNQRVGLFKNIDTNRLYYKFLKYLLETDLYKTLMSGICVAGAQPNISPRDIEEMFFYIPSTEEQQKIADFLSTIDEKLDCEKNILNELTELKKGLLQRIFA